jgi:hypothetical protein
VKSSTAKVNGGNEIAKTGDNKFIVLFIAIALFSGWIGLIVDMA